MSHALTNLQAAALRLVARYSTEPFGGGIASSRAIPKRLLERLTVLGLAESVGMQLLADGDGWLVQPERYREAWRITAKGRRWLSSLGAK